MTNRKLEDYKKEIDSMSQRDMAYMWRFAPLGSALFGNKCQELHDYFAKVFKEKGGMTPEISKSIGWDII